MEMCGRTCVLLMVTATLCCQLLLCALYILRFTFRPTPVADISTSDWHQSSRTVTKNLTISRTATEKFQRVMQVYLQRYAEMKVKREHLPNATCPAVFENKSPVCWFPGCNASFPPLQERLQRLLQTQYPVTTEHRTLIDNMANHPEYVDVAFVTAASANHFDESQGLIKDLHQLVFPELRRQGLLTSRLYYYDLGLAKGQRKKLTQFCNCTVLSFPFPRLPAHFRKLPTCIWKPLIIKAHLNSSRYTLWMDACIRLKDKDITPILDKAGQLGVFVGRNHYMFMLHVHPAMLSYFQIQPCLLASFYEMAAGFIALHNDAFVHNAILDPWVACAFSPNCLCPMEGGENCERFIPCKTRESAYFRCHRFDQSALGIILIHLFDSRVGHLTHTLVDNTKTPWFAFERDRSVRYFP